MQSIGAGILETNFDDGIRLHCATLLAINRRSAVADMLLNGVKDDVLRLQSRTILGEYASMEVTADQFDADYKNRDISRVVDEWTRVCGWKTFYNTSGSPVTPWQYFANGEIWGDMPFPERILHRIYGEAMLSTYQNVKYCDVAEKYFTKCRNQYPDLEDRWNEQANSVLRASAGNGASSVFARLAPLSNDLEELCMRIIDSAASLCHAEPIGMAVEHINNSGDLIDLARVFSSERGYAGYLTITGTEPRFISGEYQRDKIKMHEMILNRVLQCKQDLNLPTALEQQIYRKLESLELERRNLADIFSVMQKEKLDFWHALRTIKIRDEM